MRSRGFLNRNDGYIWHVYDAVSGERTELRDVTCPFKTVDFVFDNENVRKYLRYTYMCFNQFYVRILMS